MAQVRPSNCHHCGYLCAVNVVVGDNDTIEKIWPDPSRYPYDAGLVNRCHRFAALSDYLDHPDRINYPIKQTGGRGSGNWQQVTWNEALDEIAHRLNAMKAQYGAESLATAISAPHAIYWPMHRFLNLWGSPNNIGIGISCWNPRIWVNSLTFGWPIEDEIVPGTTGCAVVWGMNPAASDHSLFWKTINDFVKAGGTLVVIDPRHTKTAHLARHWLAPRPGTDGALALGMLHVIIKEKWYDHEFVNNWCNGFGALSRRIDTYSPDKVSQITGIKPSMIVQTASAYAASKPAALITGLGIDMGGANCTQALRAIAILRAITGNLDTPGASYIHERSDFVPEAEMELSHLLPVSQREKKLGRGLFALQRYSGYQRLNRLTRRHGKQLPARYLTSAHPHLAWQAMLTGEPYPIRGLFTYASNPLLCQANTAMVHQAIRGLDLVVCLEHFMSPTAMLADFVLPMAGSLEQSMVQTNGGIANMAYGGPAAIAPRHERRTGFDFWRALGNRCGQQEHWPWETVEDALDTMFAPAGVSWSDVCATGLYAPGQTYEKYFKDGFATASGKVELASQLMEEMGFDPLPHYNAMDDRDPEYPLDLITGARRQPYYSSQHRQVQRLRKRHPDPVVEMAAETAERLGLAQGDWIWIETCQGCIRQKLVLAEMRPDTVSVDYGWWFPERGTSEPDLGGFLLSNANVLTNADTALCDSILGQWSTRSLRCKVYNAAEK